MTAMHRRMRGAAARNQQRIRAALSDGHTTTQTIATVTRLTTTTVRAHLLRMPDVTCREHVGSPGPARWFEWEVAA